MKAATMPMVFVSERYDDDDDDDDGPPPAQGAVPIFIMMPLDTVTMDYVTMCVVRSMSLHIFVSLSLPLFSSSPLSPSLSLFLRPSLPLSLSLFKA